jgi:aspartate 1-decarboxylase
MGVLRNYVQGKLHGLRITQCKLKYNGSCEIDPALLRAARIDYYEQVHIYNMTNGARFVTYVFPGGAPGAFTLNGGAARHGAEGDECIVVAYRQEEKFSGAKCVIINPADNSVKEVMEYEPASVAGAGETLREIARADARAAAETLKFEAAAP